MNKQLKFPWEQNAMRGEDMPDGLTLADQMAYIALRNIYWSYHERRMSREQARIEKRKLYREWEKALEAQRFDREMTMRHVRQIKAQERAICACRKNPTAENAIRLCDALDGLEVDT